MAGLSVPEVATLVGVSEQAVRKALGSGRLTGRRGQDGTWVVEAEDAHRWKTQRSQPGPRPNKAERPRALTPTPTVTEPDLVPAMHALIKAHDDLLQVVRDLTDQVERARRAGYDAVAPTG